MRNTCRGAGFILEGCAAPAARGSSEQESRSRVARARLSAPHTARGLAPHHNTYRGGCHAHPHGRQSILVGVRLGGKLTWRAADTDVVRSRSRGSARACGPAERLGRSTEGVPSAVSPAAIASTPLRGRAQVRAADRPAERAGGCAAARAIRGARRDRTRPQAVYPAAPGEDRASIRCLFIFC